MGANGPPAPPAPAPPPPPDPPNLGPVGSGYPQGSGQNLRAFSVGGGYAGNTTTGHTGSGSVAIGFFPQGAAVGAEIVANGSAGTGNPGTGAVGMHVWVPVGDFNISVYGLRGTVGGQTPPGATGNSSGSASVGGEALIGESRDKPRVTVGAALQVATADHAATTATPSAPTTYIDNPFTIGGIVNVNIALRYGAGTGPTSRIPRFTLWGEVSWSNTSGSGSTVPSPTGTGTVTQPSASTTTVTGTAGLTYNLPITSSGLHVVSFGGFVSGGGAATTTGGVAAPIVPFFAGGGGASYSFRF
jgi:hypothetical protein